MLLVDASGDLRLAAASTDRMHALDLFEIQKREGLATRRLRVVAQAIVDGAVPPERIRSQARGQNA